MSLRSAITRIRSIPELQKKYNIFITLDRDAEQKLQDKEQKDQLLSYLVAGIKDNIVTKDMRTTCGSEILNDYVSPYDATCIKMLRDSGSIIIGKTNMDEFGMGSGGLHSYFKPVINPLFDDQKKVAGGSSSGSAAAVAAGAVDFALGTDTGGSVRLPAAYTSILGFKPSYGRISRHGVIAYAQSLDCVGILAKEYYILKKVFSVLDKHDDKDPTSLSKELREKASQRTKKNKTFRIGIPQEFIQNSIPSEMRTTYLNFVEKLMSKGHEVFPVTIPSAKDSLPIYYTLTPAEAASNLSRYDGIRYGERDEKRDIQDGTLFAPTRSKFGTEVQNRIILGNYNLCSAAFKDHYVKAQKLRVKLINDFDAVFRLPNLLFGSKGNENGVDFILSLTATNYPPTIDSFHKADLVSPTNEYLNDVFTMPMSLAGLPTLSLPPLKNVPIGVQLTGQYADDISVIDFCSSLED
ncbi:hypothetical protein HG535_0E00540 [Zygotorulaspora mrakii]|uniref:Glutamyl-tRNA(Gln) amidotransferase subunit A, mitochondrial n=1 Tax=Zygotorulaspora mrakii TaxID=42260 RepID=A0A7H9B2W7_ZYGMR|nr:uncharacterized protein HG535_0E00540 [Zygotorulaspora mrakii]QLG72970.1 hypothetical protein HG535_0E00540 [Zygotorulaspora mrakii]